MIFLKKFACVFFSVIFFLSSFFLFSTPSSAFVSESTLLMYELLASAGAGAGVAATTGTSDFTLDSIDDDIHLNNFKSDTSGLSSTGGIPDEDYTTVTLNDGTETLALKYTVNLDDYRNYLSDIYSGTDMSRRSIFQIDYDYPDPPNIAEKRKELHPMFTYGRIFTFAPTSAGWTLCGVMYVPYNPSLATTPFKIAPKMTNGAITGMDILQTRVLNEDGDLEKYYSYYYKLYGCHYSLETAYGSYLKYSPGNLTDYLVNSAFESPVSTLGNGLNGHRMYSGFKFLISGSWITCRFDFPVDVDISGITGDGSEYYTSVSDELAKVNKKLDDLKKQGITSYTGVYYPDSTVSDDLKPAGIPTELINNTATNITYNNYVVSSDGTTTGGNTGGNTGTGEDENVGGILGLLGRIWTWLTDKLWETLSNIGNIMSNVWNWITDFSTTITNVLTALFVPSPDYWDTKPPPMELVKSKFPIVTKTLKMINNSFNVSDGDLILSFEWYDIDNIFNYPNENKLRTYYVDFNWYKPYREYIRGGLSVVMFLLFFLASFRTIAMLFGVGLMHTSAISVGIGNMPRLDNAPRLDSGKEVPLIERGGTNKN